jgi:hypothetical protein
VLLSRPYQLLVVNSKGKTGDTKEWVCEVLKYKGSSVLLSEFEQWNVPRFPLNGNMLKEKGVPGKFTVCKLKLVHWKFLKWSHCLNMYTSKGFFFLIKLPETTERQYCVCSECEGNRKISRTICKSCVKGLHPKWFYEHKCSTVSVRKK